MAQRKLAPKFKVRALEGKVTRRKCKLVKGKNAKGNPVTRFEYTDVEEPAGFMVYFPGGHSIRVRDQEELERLGLTEAPPLIDMNTGEIVEVDDMVDLEQQSERMTKQSRKEHFDNA